MKTWKNTDKSNWPRGEWDNEPDKSHWIDDETGLDCLIVRGPLGALCGYVGVPKAHPSFEQGYSDVAVTVHGGLTFADSCQPEEDESEGICHSEECAANDDVWRLGFDCAHCNDLAPASNMIFNDSIYRNFEYTVQQVTSLAGQLKATTQNFTH